MSHDTYWACIGKTPPLYVMAELGGQGAHIFYLSVRAYRGREVGVLSCCFPLCLGSENQILFEPKLTSVHFLPKSNVSQAAVSPPTALSDKHRQRCWGIWRGIMTWGQMRCQVFIWSGWCPMVCSQKTQGTNGLYSPFALQTVPVHKSWRRKKWMWAFIKFTR